MILSPIPQDCFSRVHVWDFGWPIKVTYMMDTTKWWEWTDHANFAYISKNSKGFASYYNTTGQKEWFVIAFTSKSDGGSVHKWRNLWTNDKMGIWTTYQNLYNVIIEAVIKSLQLYCWKNSYSVCSEIVIPNIFKLQFTRNMN